MPTTISPGAPVQAPCALAVSGMKVTKPSAAIAAKIKVVARMDTSLNPKNCASTTASKVKFAQKKSRSDQQTAYPRAVARFIDFVKRDEGVTLAHPFA